MLTSSLNNRDFYNLVDAMFRPVTPENRASANALSLDVFETGDTLNIRALMPGISPENAEIKVENNVLTISGENHFARTDSSEMDPKIYRRENIYGKFSRSVRLPDEFDATKATAAFDHGFVTVKLPRAESAKPKVITIPIETVHSISSGREGENN